MPLITTRTHRRHRAAFGGDEDWVCFFSDQSPDPASFGEDAIAIINDSKRSRFKKFSSPYEILEDCASGQLGGMVQTLNTHLVVLSYRVDLSALLLA
jgi:hypothetical protein